MSPLVIGTRGSELALWQAGFVRDALQRAHPGLDVRLQIIATRGDIALEQPTHASLDKGLFTTEIQDALRGGEIDLAVHSHKDLPTRSPEGLVVAAIPQREDPSDALVLREGLAGGDFGFGIWDFGSAEVTDSNPRASSGPDGEGTQQTPNGKPLQDREQGPTRACDLASVPPNKSNPHRAAEPSEGAPVQIRNPKSEIRDFPLVPEGAEILTGSLRRGAQLLHLRPDLKVLPVRGNVPTRLRKLDEGGACGIVLALAGLRRLGLEHRVSLRLDPGHFVPACGQGALAIEVRRDDARVRDLIEAIDDRSSHLAVLCERSFLALLHAGCRAPVGAYARFGNASPCASPKPTDCVGGIPSTPVNPPDTRNASLTVTGVIASPDGSRLFRDTLTAPVTGRDSAIALGESLAERLLSAGAGAVLDEAGVRAPRGNGGGS